MGRDTSVLITGARGQAGRALHRLLPDAVALDRAALDVTDPEAVVRALGDVDVVVHLAALTDVDRCERDPSLTELVNVVGTRNVVEGARRSGARVILLSTDQVFDGRASREYVEEDAPCPVNCYGRSKVAAEAIVEGLPDGLIIRTSWVIGEGRNFVEMMLALGARLPEVSVVSDQRGRPTFATDLAVAIRHAIDESLNGVLHVAGDGPPCTRADLAEAVFEGSGTATTVRSVTTAEFRASASGVVAPRPANAVLSIERARGLGVPLMDWKTSLSRYLDAGP